MLSKSLQLPGPKCPHVKGEEKNPLVLRHDGKSEAPCKLLLVASV